MWSEVELGFRLLPGARFVGVTGTNGKTTTTELLGAIFRAAGRDVAVAGNVGTPLTSVREADWVVCELSSFQLEDVHELACDVAVLLNLEPDHLDRHGSFAAYRDAKLRIFERARAKVVPRGLGLDGIEFAADDAAAGRAADPRGAQSRERRGGDRGRARCRASTTRRSQRRCERSPACRTGSSSSRERDGVRYVNDSKATNVAAALRALAAYSDEPVHLILGGSPKGEDFAPLAAAIGPNVRSVHLIGAEAPRLARGDRRRPRRDARSGRRARAAARPAGRCRPPQPGVCELRPVRELRGARRDVPRARRG